MAWRHSEFGFALDRDGLTHWLIYAPRRRDELRLYEHGMCGANVYVVEIYQPQEGYPTCLQCARLTP